jgi:UDP-N-acetylglucosamine--N-acetylmuramyl-(pentapeptide) pyrophosphoryl-undecaprenol N-acetylglucosamine transferase
LIAAGGTGGHVYPGIAVANEVRRRDPESEILFVGTSRGLEVKIVPAAGYQLSLIQSSGLKSVGISGMLKGLVILPKSFVEARKVLRDFRPDVVVGAGGYVSGPTLLMAAVMAIPTIVMDSNALPGFTNRRLARFIDVAALSFDEALPYFGSKGVVTGNPVRSEFFDIDRKERGEKQNILIFGGSQGSRAINNAMTDALPHLDDLRSRLSIVHQTGPAELEAVSSEYEKAGFADAEIRDFISDIYREFANADLVICRAGATTCAELAAAGKASLMVPLPTAADDHQRKNAEAFASAGAARMILQSDISGKTLADAIREFVDSPDAITKMEEAARKLSRRDAAEATVDIIERLAKVKTRKARKSVGRKQHV